MSGMDPQEGDATQTITITGSDFSTTPCQNKVTLGDNECVVATASATEITCDINTQSFPVSQYQPLRVVVDNMGTATQEEEMGFTAQPLVSTITPTHGSVHGGSSVTITGSALCHECPTVAKRDLTSGGDQNAVVYIGSVECRVMSAEFGEIICVTGSAPGDIVGTVTVTVNSDGEALAAVCDDGDCEFSFATDSTPTITTPSDAVDTPNQILTIEGTLLDTVISVFLGDTECTVESSSATSITCDVGNPVAGSQALKVVTANGATSVATVTVTGSISSLSPVTGSTEGMTRLQIDGFGF